MYTTYFVQIELIDSLDGNFLDDHVLLEKGSATGCQFYDVVRCDSGKRRKRPKKYDVVKNVCDCAHESSFLLI